MIRKNNFPKEMSELLKSINVEFASEFNKSDQILFTRFNQTKKLSEN